MTRVIALVASVALSVLACSSPVEPRTTNPSLVGTVTQVHSDGDEVWLLVESLEVPAQGYVSVALYLRGTDLPARIFVTQRDFSLSRGSIADVPVGASIKAWSTGTERKSLPPQWDATQVTVVLPP